MANKINGNSILSDLTLNDVLDFLKREVMFSMNCHAIGQIQSFDAETQTAQIGINYTQTKLVRDPSTNQYNKQFPAYPALIDCPVVVLGGGSQRLTFGIKPGDDCLVLFNDRDINNWFAGSNNGPPASTRLHSFSDAIAIVGLRSLSNSIPDYDSDNATLGDIEASYVQIKAEKIKIANATTTLLTVINGLIDILSTGFGGTTPAPGNPLNPTAQAALTAYKTTVGGLLE